MKPTSFGLFCAMCQVKDSRLEDVYIDAAKAAEFNIGRSAFFDGLNELEAKGWIKVSRKEGKRKFWNLVKGFGEVKSANVDYQSPQTWTIEDNKVRKRGLLKSANVDFPPNPLIRNNSTKIELDQRGGGVEYSTPAHEAETTAPPPNPVEVFFELEKAVETIEYVEPLKALEIHREVFPDVSLSQKEIDFLKSSLPNSEIDETLWRQNLIYWDLRPKWQKDNIVGQIDRFNKELKRKENDNGKTEYKRFDKDDEFERKLSETYHDADFGFVSFG